MLHRASGRVLCQAHDSVNKELSEGSKHRFDFSQLTLKILLQNQAFAAVFEAFYASPMQRLAPYRGIAGMGQQAKWQNRHIVAAVVDFSVQRIEIIDDEL